MRILFYTNDLRFGGAQRVISILANTFSEQGHTIGIFLYSEHTDRAYPLNKEIIVNQLDNRFRLANLLHNHKEMLRTRKAILDFMPDVLISFYAKDTVMVSMALAGKSIPIVYSQRCDPYNAPFKERCFDKIAVRLASAIVFQSTKARDYYPHFVRQKSEVIMNPLQTHLLPNTPPPGRRKDIVAVGRLSEQKNHRLLIDAFREINGRIPDYRLVIYGEGPLRHDMEMLIADSGLQDRVILMGNDSHVIKHISDASLFVLPSNYEGIPNALIEAMCIGLPCISTDWSPYGAIADLITNGVNGIVVPSKDSSSLATAILKIIENPSLAQQLGQNAKRLTDKVQAPAIASRWIEWMKPLIPRNV